MKISFLTIAALMLAGISLHAQSSDTVRTTSGLRYVVTQKGAGAQPKEGNLVLVHYTGTFLDGKVFDSSRQRGEPFAFRLGKGQVIKGWDEGIALLRVGDRATLVIPPDIAYGANDRGSIPANSTLVFDVELIGIAENSVGDEMGSVIEKKGIRAAVVRFRELRKIDFENFYMSEGELNGLGYRLLKENKVKEAIAVFELNVEMYPASGNVYDSLGEAYMIDGDKQQAISNYRKSLELDPSNANAVEMLKKLEAPAESVAPAR